MKYIGTHVSASSGVFNAPQNAHKIGATAFSLFTKNQCCWETKDLDQDTIQKFKAACLRYNYKPEQILPYIPMILQDAKSARQIMPRY